MNTLNTLVCSGFNDWNNLFTHMESVAKAETNSSGELLCRYLGEIDCPEEMLFRFAPLSAIEHCGKTNWFVCSDGTFYTCGDYEADYIFESGKCVEYHFNFEKERDAIYSSLSTKDKIVFRMKLQRISFDIAKEIVCEEI